MADENLQDDQVVFPLTEDSNQAQPIGVIYPVNQNPPAGEKWKGRKKWENDKGSQSAPDDSAELKAQIAWLEARIATLEAHTRIPIQHIPVKE